MLIPIYRLMLGCSKINSLDRCCLCGSADKLTGEHKVKASALRSIFAGDSMMIGHFDGSSRPKLAQSATSKAFHFRPRLCGACNSTRTQAADLEFARFDELARRLLSEEADPGTAFDNPRYAIGTTAYLNVFRYFAKVLACQIADVDGPRLIALTDFALGRTDRNIIRLAMDDQDPMFRAWFDATGDPQFAGHGGLGVEFSRSKRRPKEIFSTLTHGALRYRFSVAFGFPIAMALRFLHPSFHEKLVTAFELAIEQSEGSKPV